MAQTPEQEKELLRQIMAEVNRSCQLEKERGMKKYYEEIKALLNHHDEGLITRHELEMKLLDVVEKAFFDGYNTVPRPEEKP